MSSEAIIIPLFFGVIGAVIVTVNRIFGGVARRRYLHRERMAALEKGVPLPDDVLSDDGGAGSRTQPRVGLQGVVWTSLGIGLLISSQAVPSSSFGNDFQQFLAFLSIWAYPAMTVGIGLMIYAFVTRQQPPHS